MSLPKFWAKNYDYGEGLHQSNEKSVSSFLKKKRKKNKKKLAMLRTDCPFGLNVPFHCKTAGDSVLKMNPSSDDNLDFIDENEPKKCYYANIIKDDYVDCGYNDEKDLAPVGSPYFPKMFSGTALNGTYTTPLSYVDNSINNGFYYGPYSTESLASANNEEYICKSSFEVQGFNKMEKQSQLQLDGLKIKPENLAIFDELNDLDLDSISVDAEDSADLRVDMEFSPENPAEENALKDGGEVSGDLLVALEDGDLKKEFSFTLPPVPGADDQTEIEEPTDIDVDEEEDIKVESDPWDWKLENYMEWLHNKMNNPPKHSGKTIIGLEKVISYFKRLLDTASKASRIDYDDILDSDQLELARDEMLKAIKRCEERIDKIENNKRPKKKKADSDDDGEIIKTARAAQYQINVSMFISHIARTLINGYVSAGHDLENSFIKLDKEYEFSKREKAEVLQLLADMGFPIRRDRGIPMGTEIDQTSPNNIDWMANYPG